MTQYKCKCGNTKELSVATIVHIDGDWETKEAYCKPCGKYMQSEPLEGMPMGNQRGFVQMRKVYGLRTLRRNA